MSVRKVLGVSIICVADSIDGEGLKINLTGAKECGTLGVKGGR